MKWRSALLCCLAVSGCQSLPPPMNNTPIALNAGDTAAIEEGVRGQLKDPNSAQFEGFQAVQDVQGNVYVCGWVNAKNSFGGYTGRKPFLGILVRGSESAFAPVSVGGSDDRTAATRHACGTYGIAI